MLPALNITDRFAPHRLAEPAAALSTMELPPSLRPLRYGATQKPWRIMDGTSMRPGYHLTPQKLWTAYRQAEISPDDDRRGVDAPAARDGGEIVAERAQRPFNESIRHGNGGEVYVLASIETSYAIPFI